VAAFAQNAGSAACPGVLGERSYGKEEAERELDKFARDLKA
jgi:hypothetical protein